MTAAHALPALPTPPADGPLLVGFSGGLDSTVLLHLLASDAVVRARGLRAIHVHHGLQPQADAWEQHCRDACDALGIALQLARVAVVPAGDGPEAAARAARHAAFAAALAPGELLVLAHHRDDQAETFLLRALRGSGVDGLAAMRPWRAFGAGWLWRPLLHVPRDALHGHARAHALRWIEDPDNANADRDRNYLRHHVLPAMRARWPGADAGLARAAGLAADAAGLLAGDDASLLATVRATTADTLAVSALRVLPDARRARVLRHWIAGLGLPPLPAEGIARIEADLLDAAPDRQARFAWAGAVVERWRDLLHAHPSTEDAPLPMDWQANWDGRAPLRLPGGGLLWLRGAIGFDAPLQARARRGGERIALPGRMHSHALKHVLQDRAVPPWRRRRLPLLFDGDALLAAGDVACAARFDAWLRARGATLRWQPHDAAMP